MNELRAVHAQATAGHTPVFVRLVVGSHVFEGSTESGALAMMTLDDADVQDDLAEDIEMGLAALDEPVVATWESVKERLGL